MRRKILTVSFVWLTILGSTMLAWYFMTGEKLVTSMDEITYFGVTMYRINIPSYLNNILNTLETIKVLEIKTPTTPVNDWTDVISSIKTIICWLMYFVNLIIFIVNAIIFTPFKLIMWFITVSLSFIGLNGTTLVNNMTKLYNINIPYLQYSWL